MTIAMAQPQSVINMPQPQQRPSTTQVKPPRQPKLRSSCDNCQATKVKCSKDKPSCRRCTNQGVPCVYGISRRMGRPRPSNKEAALNSQKPPQSQPQSRKHTPVHSRQSSITSMHHLAEGAPMEYFAQQPHAQKPANMGGAPMGMPMYPNDLVDHKFHVDDLGMPKMPSSFDSDWTGFDPSMSPRLNDINGPFSFDPIATTLGPDPSAHLTESPINDDSWLATYCNDQHIASPAFGNPHSFDTRPSISSHGSSSGLDSYSAPSSGQHTPLLQHNSLSGTMSPQAFFDLQHSDPSTPALTSLLDLHLSGDSSNLPTPTGPAHGRLNSICSSASSVSSNAGGYNNANHPFTPTLSRTASSLSNHTTPPSSATSQAGGDCSCQNSVLDILTKMHASENSSASLNTILNLEQTAEVQILRMLNCYDCLENRRSLMLVSLIIGNVINLLEIAASSISASSPSSNGSSSPTELANQLESLMGGGPGNAADPALLQQAQAQHSNGQLSEQQWRELNRRLIQVRLGKVYNLLERLSTSMDGESRATCGDTLMDLQKRLRLVLGKVEMGGSSQAQ